MSAPHREENNMTKTWAWLNEKTKGRTSQFELICQRSNYRIDVEGQKMILNGKRNEIQKLQKNLESSKNQFLAYKEVVEGIEKQLDTEKAFVKASNLKVGRRIAELQEKITLGRENLKGMEDTMEVAAAQTRMFLVDLKKSETQLEVLRIRNELATERERQLVTLRTLIESLVRNEEDGEDKAVGQEMEGTVTLEAASVQDHHGTAAETSLQDQWKVQIREEMTREREKQLMRLKAFLHTIPGLEVDGDVGVQHKVIDKVQYKKDLKTLLETCLMLNSDRAAWIAENYLRHCEPKPASKVRLSIDFLKNEMNIGREKICSMINAHPEMLNIDADVSRAIVDFLQRELRIEPTKITSLSSSFPSILSLDVEYDLKPRIAFYMENLKLQHEEIVKILQTSPRLLAADHRTVTSEVIGFFRNEMKIKAEDLGQLVLAYPSILSCCVNNQMRPVFQWLMKIGIPIEKMSRILKLHPKVMSYSLENNLKPTVQYLWDEVGINREQIGRVICSYPHLLGLSVDLNLRPMMQYLLVGADVPAEKLSKIFSSFPQLFGLSLDDNIRMHIDFLVKEVGIPKSRLGKTIASFPHILAYKIKDNLRPTVAYLHGELGIPRERMGKLVSTHPQILGYSVETKLRPMAKYLIEEVGIPKEKIGVVVEKCPKIVGCSVDRNLRPTVGFLLEEVGLTRAQVGAIVTKYPSLLGLSIEHNLRPKIHYLVREIKVDEEVIRQQLVSSPQLLAYSLEQRIKPRHRLLIGKGLKLGLHSMLAPTDNMFYRRYGDGKKHTPAIKKVTAISGGNYYWQKDPQASPVMNAIPLAADSGRA